MRAETLLKSALALDPEFALAHATLAETYAIRTFKSPLVALRETDGKTMADLALESAARALSLEPDLIEAYAARALVHFMRNEPKAVLAALARVLELNPDRPQELEWTAWVSMAGGHPEEAFDLVKHLIQRYPDRYRAYSQLAITYELLGRQEEACEARALQIERLTEYVRRHPDRAHPRSQLATALAREGRCDDAFAQASLAVEQSPHDGSVLYNQACVHALCGRRELAVELMVKTYGNEVFKPPWILRDPDLASLRDHPEFIRAFGRSEG